MPIWCSNGVQKNIAPIRRLLSIVSVHNGAIVSTTWIRATLRQVYLTNSHETWPSWTESPLEPNNLYKEIEKIANKHNEIENNVL